jgi:hypothetical protein
VINEPLRARSSRRLRLRVLRDLRGFKEKQQMDEDTYSLKKNKNRNRIMSAVLLIFITPGLPCPLWAGKPSPYRRRLLILIPIMSIKSKIANQKYNRAQ